MQLKKSYLLGDIANLLNAELRGDPLVRIEGLAGLQAAAPGQISFLASNRYQMVESRRYEKILLTTKASAVLLAPEHVKNCPVAALVISDPYPALIQLAKLFDTKEAPPPGVHQTAIIGKGVHLGQNVSIGPYCVIGNHVYIDDHVSLGAHTVLEDNVRVGSYCHLDARVTLHQDVVIGDHAIIASGTVIGSMGFGMIRQKEGWVTMPHLGSVVIGDRVEIGANTTIDRGRLENTQIGNGVKLDNLIQIAHGVIIGDDTVIAGCTGIAGSARIGKNCMIGGACAISDNIEVGDGVIITGMSQVTKSITRSGIYSSGTGILPQKEWQKSVARLHRLDEMARKLRQMEKKHYE